MADIHALAAVDALVIPHPPHVHAAVPHARAAAVAAAGVYLHADDVEPAEQAVDRPQRTEEAAEAAVAEHAGQADCQHDDELAGEQRAQHAVEGGVDRIGQEPHRALEGARRAEVLAEGRQRKPVAQAVPQGQGDHEHGQDDVFQPGQRPGDRALFELRRRNPVQQLLDQAHRTQPAADRPAQRHTEEQQDAQHVPARPMSGGGQRVLQGTQRTGAHRARTGITVEAGDAGSLRVPGVDPSVDEALEAGVVQQGRIQLRQPPGRRPVRPPPPGFLRLIQGQHTPYRW